MDELKWFTSSYSGGAENCVEVGVAPDRRAVRDSKHANGELLMFRAASFRAFVNAAKVGRAGCPTAGS